MEDSEYWKQDEERFKHLPPLPPRKRPCDDCPVILGMYSGYAESLKNQPDDIRRSVSERWFCHTNTDRACRGNWEIQQMGKLLSET